MALGTPTHKGGGVATAGTATSGSFTCTIGAILIAFCASRRDTTVPAKLTVSDTLGHTWTEIGDFSDATADARIRLTAYATVVTSAAVMTVSAVGSTGTNATQAIEVSQITGASITFGTPGYGFSATGDPSGTISAVTAGSGVLGFAMFAGDNVAPAPTGFTQIFELGRATTNIIVMTGVYDLTSPATTATWATTLTRSLAMVIEVKEATVNVSALALAGAAEIVGQVPITLVAPAFDTFLRPMATQSIGGWQTEVAGSNLHVSIDETAASDGDYIRSPVSPSNAECVVKLDAGTLDSALPTHVLYRYRKEGTATLSLTVRLLSPLATERASALHSNIASTFVDGILQLTEGEAASVDWSDAYLAFSADV
jgi:hypothetical protein